VTPKEDGLKLSSPDKEPIVIIKTGEKPSLLNGDFNPKKQQN
jgi:hypothetical protein